MRKQSLKVTGCALPALCLISAACTPMVFPEVRLVALGDSITGNFESDPATYPTFLVDILNLPQSLFAAEGSGGRTTPEGLRRLREIVDFHIYPNAEEMIYFLGAAEIIDFVASNDPGLALAPSDPNYPFRRELNTLLANVRTSMRLSLELALAQDWELYIATYFDLPAGKSPCDPLAGNELNELEGSRANEYVELLNSIILELAEEFSIPVIDLRQDNEELLSNLNHFADCVHPSESGAMIIAERFAQTLQPNQ